MLNFRYVEGLLFNEAGNLVKLIHKKRGPASIVGKWNGIGGKIEPRENALEAMLREGKEESGVFTGWKCFLSFKRLDFSINFFYSFDQLAFENAKTCEDELIETFPVRDLPDNLCSELFWVIPIAIETRKIKRFYTIEVDEQ